MKIIQIDQPTSVEIQPLILDVANRSFDDVKASYVDWRMANMPDISLFVAIRDGIWVGFKLGYAMTQRRYYSWLGGVAADVRGQGVASMLMHAQHQWLSQTSYQIVETHVRRDNLAMIATNQKFGLRIVGRFNKGDQVNLIMQRDVQALNSLNL